MYTMSPIQEQKYLTNLPEKTVKFEDYLYCNTNLSAKAKGDSVYNSQLFSSISRGILLIPLMASTVHPNNISANPTYGSPLLSPFSGCGTCPYSRVSNFNVLINGSSWFSNNINYGWDIYYNEILKSKGTIFRGGVQGMRSGLLSQTDWETNHSYVYICLDRWESISEDNAPRNIGLQFTSSSNVACDYHCFLMYEKEITINSNTGMLVKKS